MSILRIPKSTIPNTATSLNVFSGFLSIVFASKGEFHLAALLIFIATFFDLIDGLLARLTKTASPFGVELDSLADVVSFGVAPSFLIYQAYFIKFDVWGIIFSSLLLIFGALRLARFNVQVEDIKIKQDFSGLPIPIAAITIASFILFFYNGVKVIKPFDIMMIPTVIILALLMVSKIRYNTLPKMKNMSSFIKVLIYSIAILLLALVYLTDGVAFFYILVFHILFGIFRHIYLMIFNNSKISLTNGK